MLATVGQLLVNESLPPELRDYTRTLGQDEINDLLGRVAHEYPEKYKEISWKLVQLGRNAAFDEGATITLNDLVPVVDKKPLLDLVRKQEQAIRTDKTLTEEQKDEAIETLYGEATKRLTEETYANALANKNPFALQAKYKARGNKNQLGAMLTSPGTYTDSSGKIVPIFIGSAYAEGLKPHEYWAAGYGARLGILGTKLGTQKGGYLSKMMNAAAIDQVVTEDDCGTANGLPVSVDDDDNIGSVLQQDAAGFKAGTVITKPVLDKIRAAGEDEIVIRSPITCSCKNGLCKRCVGIRENGRFPEIGYNAGVNAASALGEQIAQNSLNTKHCLSYGTKVRMADWSEKTIQDIVVGDRVLGSDLQGNLRPVKVLATFDNGRQACVRSFFKKHGTSHKGATCAMLESTESHKILGAPDRGEAPCQLAVGTKCRRFLAFTASTYTAPRLKHEPLAALAGVLIGDCCYSSTAKTLRLSSQDPLEISDLKEGLKGLDVSFHRRAYPYVTYYRLDGKAVSSFLRREKMFGQTIPHRTLPASIHSWDNASVSSFIGGFVASTGSVSRDGRFSTITISVPATSLCLLEGVKQLLRDRFGILTTAITISRSAGSCAGRHNVPHTQYRLDITARPALEEFARLIPVPGRKRRLLKRLLKDVPQPRLRKQQCLELARIERIGVRHVYDIMVDCPDHLFLLANGLIVSNSGKRSDLGSYVGFDALKNLAMVPKAYDVKASVTPRDGSVSAIEDAPQGGQYVILDDDRDQKIYVPPTLKVSVKPGEKLEAGDAVSTGLVSPSDIVAYKGIGEGRRYFTDRFRKVFTDSHYGVNRRNVEILSRALVNNVQVENPDAEGDALPGDIVRYSAWAGAYTPRTGAAQTPIDKSIGQYLETPVLHYTVGTRITPSVVKTLKKHGRTDVLVNKTAPGVVPHMVSVVEAPAYSGDWMARLGTSYLKDRLLEDAQVGAHSELHGTNPVPGLAKGVEFGKDMAHTGAY